MSGTAIFPKANKGAALVRWFRNTPLMQVTQTKHGLRLSQHGVVISELRTAPGPTHSVFDVLAALLVLLQPAGRIGVLGFAGGGMLAPLQALGMNRPFATVDLDCESYNLFCRHCPEWEAKVRWEHADAARWLQRQKAAFDLLLDDLSIPQDGDVVKPEICWSVLPDLMRRKLKRDGIAVFNLVSSPAAGWRAGMKKVVGKFSDARVIHLDDFENRIVIAGNQLPSAQHLGRGVRNLLREIQSRQAGRLRVRAV